MEPLQLIASVDQDLTVIANNYRAVRKIDEQATIVYCQKLAELAQSVNEKTRGQYDLYLLLLCKIMDQLRLIYICLAPTMARLELCQQLFVLCTKAILGIQWNQLPEDDPGKRGLRIVLDATHRMLSPAGYTRIELLLGLMDTHWGDPVLSKIMSNDCEDEQEGKAYIEKEDPMVLKLRVEVLLEEDCDEFVINLCHWCTFHPMLKDDLYLRQTQLLLLHRHNYVAKFREECQKISCDFGVQIVRSLEQQEQHRGVCVLLAQTFLIQDWINPNSYCCTKDLLKLWIRHQYLSDKDVDKFSDSIWSIAKLSRNTKQLGMLIEALRKECGLDKFLQLYTDLAIYALNLDKGIWDCAKSFGDEGAIGMSEKAIARTCVQIHNLYQDLNPQVQQRSIITAFALDPSSEHFTQLGKIYEQKIVGVQKPIEGGHPHSFSIAKSGSINVDSLKQALPLCGEQTVGKQHSLEETAPMASTSSNGQVVITDNTKMQMQVDMGSARILEKGSNRADSINPATLYEMDRLLKLFRPWFFNPLLPWKDLYIVARDYIANDKTLSPEIENQIRKTIERIEDEHDKGCDTVQLEQGNVVSRDQFLAQVLELQRAAFKKRGRGRPPLKKTSAPETDNKEVQKSSNLLEKMYKTVYKCLICSTLHEDVQQLKEHVRSICRPEGTDTQKDSEADSAGKQPSSCPLLKCRLCSTVKPTLQEFELHLATSHAAECDGTGGNIKICHLYRCKYCKVYFSRREDLQNHLNVCSVKLQRIAHGEIQPKPSGDSPASVVSSCSPNSEDSKTIAKSDLPFSGCDTSTVTDGTPIVKKKRGRKKTVDSSSDLNGESGKKGVHFHSTSDSEVQQPKKRGRKRKEVGKEEVSNTDTSESQSDRGEGRKVFHRKVKDVAKENSATRELIEKLLKSKDDDLDNSGKGKSKTTHGKLCEICASKFRNSKTLLQHYAMAHIKPYKFFTNKGKNAFMCFYCRKFFVTFLKYVNHIHLHEQRITSAVKTFKTTNPGLTTALGPKRLDDSDSDSSDDTVNLARPLYASTDSSTEMDASESKDSNSGAEESSMESTSLGTPTVGSQLMGSSVLEKWNFTNTHAFAIAESSSAEMDLGNEVSIGLIPNAIVDSSSNRNENTDCNNSNIQDPNIETVTEESLVSSCEKSFSEYEPFTCPSSSEVSTGVESNTEESVQGDAIKIESVDEEFIQFRSAPSVLQSQPKNLGAMLEASVSGMEMTPLPSDWNASLHMFVENVSEGLVNNDCYDQESVSRSSTDITEITVPSSAQLPHSHVFKEQKDSLQCNLIIEKPTTEKHEIGEESVPDSSVKQRSFADEFASIISISKTTESVKLDDKIMSKLEIDNDLVISSPDCGHPTNLVLTESEEKFTTLCPNCGQIVPADPATFTPDSPLTISPVSSPQKLGNPDWSKMLTKQLCVTISAKDRALCSLASKHLSFGVDNKSRKARSSSLDSDSKVQSSVQHQRLRRSSTNLQGFAAKIEEPSQTAKTHSDVKMEVVKKVTRRVSRSLNDPPLSDPVLTKAPKTTVKEKQTSPQKTEVIIDTVDISGICALFATCEPDSMDCAVSECEKSNTCVEKCVQDKHVCISDQKGGVSGEVTLESVSKHDKEGRVGVDKELESGRKCKIQHVLPLVEARNISVDKGEKKLVEAQCSDEEQRDTCISRRSDDKKCTSVVSVKENGKGATAPIYSLDDTMGNTETGSKDINSTGHTWSLILNIVDSKPEDTSPKDNLSVENLPSTIRDCSSVVAQLTFDTKECVAAPLLPGRKEEILTHKGICTESGKPSESEQSGVDNMADLISNEEPVVPESFSSSDRPQFPVIPVDTPQQERCDNCVKTTDDVKSMQAELHNTALSQEMTEGALSTSVPLTSCEVKFMSPKPLQQCLSASQESVQQLKQAFEERQTKSVLIDNPVSMEVAPSKTEDKYHDRSHMVEKQNSSLPAEIVVTSNLPQISETSSQVEVNSWSFLSSCSERRKETDDNISHSMQCIEATGDNPSTADKISETSIREKLNVDNVARGTLMIPLDNPRNEFISQDYGLLKSGSKSYIQDSVRTCERGTSGPAQKQLTPTSDEHQNPLDIPKSELDETGQSTQPKIIGTNERKICSVAVSPCADEDVPLDVDQHEIVFQGDIFKDTVIQLPHIKKMVVEPSSEKVEVSSSLNVETTGTAVGTKEDCHVCSEEMKPLPSSYQDEEVIVSMTSRGLDELTGNTRDCMTQPLCSMPSGQPVTANCSDQWLQKEEESENKQHFQSKDILEVDDINDDSGRKDMDGNAYFSSAAFVQKAETGDAGEKITDITDLSDEIQMDEDHTTVSDTKDSAHDTKDSRMSEDHTTEYDRDDVEINGLSEENTAGLNTKVVHASCRSENATASADTREIACVSHNIENNTAATDTKDITHDHYRSEENSADSATREITDASHQTEEPSLVADTVDITHDSCRSEDNIDNVCPMTEEETSIYDVAPDAKDASSHTKDAAPDANFRCVNDDHTAAKDTEDCAHNSYSGDDEMAVANAREIADVDLGIEDSITVADMKDVCRSEDNSAIADTEDFCKSEDNATVADPKDVCKSEDNLTIADTKDVCKSEDNSALADTKDICKSEDSLAIADTKHICKSKDNTTVADTKDVGKSEDNTTVTDTKGIESVTNVTEEQASITDTKNVALESLLSEDHTTGAVTTENAEVSHMTEDHTSAAERDVTEDLTPNKENVTENTTETAVSQVDCLERETVSKESLSPPETVNEEMMPSAASNNDVLESGVSKGSIEELPNNRRNDEDGQESLDEHSSDSIPPCQSTRSKIKRRLCETPLPETFRLNQCPTSDSDNSGLIHLKDDYTVQNSEEIDSLAASGLNLKVEIISASPENRTETLDHISGDWIPSSEAPEQSLTSDSPGKESDVVASASHLPDDIPDPKAGETTELPIKRKLGRPKKETAVSKTEKMVTRQSPANQQVSISRPQRKRTRTCLGSDYIYQFPFKQPRSKEPSTLIKKEAALKPKETKPGNYPMTRLRGSGSKCKNMPVRCRETRKKTSNEQKMFVNVTRGKSQRVTGNRRRGVGEQIRPLSTNQSKKPASKNQQKPLTDGNKHSCPKDLPQKVLRSGRKTNDVSCSSSLKSLQKTPNTDRVTRSSEVSGLSSCPDTKGPEIVDIPTITTNSCSKTPEEMGQANPVKEKVTWTEESDITNDAEEAQLTDSEALSKSKHNDGGLQKTSDIGCMSGNVVTSRNTKDNSSEVQKCDKTDEIMETSKSLEPRNITDTCEDEQKSENTITERDTNQENGCNDKIKDKQECLQEMQAEEGKCDVEKKSENVPTAALNLQANSTNQANVKFDEKHDKTGPTISVHPKATDGCGSVASAKEQKLGSGNIYRVQRCAGTQTSGSISKNRLSTSQTLGEKMKVVTRDSSLEIDAERKANFVRMGRTMSLKSRLLPKSSKPFTWDMDDNGDHISSCDSRDTKKQVDSQPEEPILLTLRKSLRSRNFEPIHRDKNFEVLRRGAVHKAARDGHGRGSTSNLNEIGSVVMRNVDTTPFEMVNRMATRRAQKSQNEGVGKRQIGETHIISAGVKPSLPASLETVISSTEIKAVPTRVSKRKVESGTNTDMRITKCAKADSVMSGPRLFTPKGPSVRNCQWSPHKNQRTTAINSTNIIVTYPGGSNSVITANANASKTVINNHIAQQLSGSTLDQVMATSKQQDRTPFDDCANSDSGSSNGDSSASGQKWKMQRKPGKQGFSFSFTKARIH